tara:strand:+ start:7173 stop:7382 length:210 start_codon:yes stop_codon:yes gene_type:complete
LKPGDSDLLLFVNDSMACHLEPLLQCHGNRHIDALLWKNVEDSHTSQMPSFGHHDRILAISENEPGGIS